MGLSFSDKALPIVPMFHANAWGLPYAALMAGADLVLPDRVHGRRVDGQPDRDAAADRGRCCADHLERRDELPGDAIGGHDISSLRLVACGGSAVPVSLMKTFEERHGVQIRQLWGMTETSPMATLAWPPPGIARGQALGAARHARAGRCAGWRRASSTTTVAPLPNDGESVGELEVRGPVDHRVVLPQHR